MVSPSPSTLVHSLKKPHWRIDVHRPEGVFNVQQFMVFLTGIVAPDFHRSRYMSLIMFQALTECLQFARKHLPTWAASVKPKKVPRYPDALGTCMAKGPAFRVDVALSRRLDGKSETMLAVYDLDDDSAPMLLAADEEIAELCDDCIGVLAAFAVEIEESTAAPD